jgi:WD40 repeat protein
LLALSRDGSLLVTASNDATAKLWNADGSAAGVLEGGLGEAAALTISPSGNRVALATTDAIVRLFAVAGGAFERSIELPMAAFALAFSPDGRHLAAGAADGRVTLWDAASGTPRGELARYPIPVGFAVFSGDGRRIATTSLSMNPSDAEAEARVRELSSGKESSAKLGVSHWNAIGFAADGNAVIVQVRDRTFSLATLAPPSV